VPGRDAEAGMGSFGRVGVDIASHVEITRRATLCRAGLEQFCGRPRRGEGVGLPGVGTRGGVISVARRHRRAELVSVR